MCLVGACSSIINIDLDSRQSMMTNLSICLCFFLQIPNTYFCQLENGQSGSETTSGISSDDADLETSSGRPGRTATLLDLYSGCGGMSTGLCSGAARSGLNLETVIFYLVICWMVFYFVGFDRICFSLITHLFFWLSLQRWAVDLNSFACQSLKFNHPQTEVWVVNCTLDSVSSILIQSVF